MDDTAFAGGGFVDGGGRHDSITGVEEFCQGKSPIRQKFVTQFYLRETRSVTHLMNEDSSFHHRVK